MTVYVTFAPIPDTTPAWKVREANRLRGELQNETNEAENGVLRWQSNGRVVPVSVFKDAFVYAPCFQALEEGNENAAFIANYRKVNANRPVSDEERFEMRAAFGPGVEVVNVLTGRKHRT